MRQHIYLKVPKNMQIIDKCIKCKKRNSCKLLDDFNIQKSLKGCWDNCIQALSFTGVCSKEDSGFDILAERYSQQCSVKRFVNTRSFVPMGGLLIIAECSNGRKIEIPYKNLSEGI